MTRKLNINWLNKCRCGNRMHTVETVRGSHVRLFEDDAVKCNACGREGVIQTCDGIATVLWETDEERAEGAAMNKSTITRARLEEIRDYDTCVTLDESAELARMALAAMDSEPVAEVCEDYAIRYISNGPAPVEGLHPGDKLYRHAHPAPETEREPIAWLNDAYLARGVVDGEAGSEDAGPGYIPVYREASPAQPAPDGFPPDEIECDICGHVSTDPEGRHYCCEDNSDD